MSETPPSALNLTALREILARVTMALDANADGDSQLHLRAPDRSEGRPGAADRLQRSGSREAGRLTRR